MHTPLQFMVPSRAKFARYSAESRWVRELALGKPEGNEGVRMNVFFISLRHFRDSLGFAFDC